jgi:phosphoenolpyruvate carboxykinase (GTP)
MNFTVKNEKLNQWIKEVSDLCQPDDIYICNGSKEEYDSMMELMVKSGSAVPLKKRLNSFHFRSDPSDVARVEDRTYISTTSQDDAGPTNNWTAPDELKKTMLGFYKGCMKGRTMYVIPFSMGPVGSPISKIGVEISDSPYVVVNMHIMTKVSEKVGCSMALRSDREQVYKSLSGREPDLVLWFGLRRQRIARKEVPGAPHRLCNGKA